MEEIIIKKDQDSSTKSVELVTDYLENYKYDTVLSYLKDIHNADIADILQNLDPVLRLSLLNIIDKNFDPEILTYLNDSVREEIIETLDIKQLANNAKSLDTDDVVDLAEDLEEKDQTIFLENLDTGEKINYKIVGKDEADLKKKLLYFQSPIGKGLIGKNKNDLVEINTPAGIKNFEIKDVKYL